MASVIAALDDDERDVRASVTDSLVAWGKVSPKIVSAMIDAQPHPHKMVRRWLVEAIARAALPEPRAVDAVLAACDDPSEYVRYQAVEQLRWRCPKLDDSRVIDALLRALEAGMSGAAGALAVQRSAEPRVLAALVAALAKLSAHASVRAFLDTKLRADTAAEFGTAALVLAQCGVLDLAVCERLLASLSAMDDSGKRMVLHALVPWVETVPDVARVCAPLLEASSLEVRISAGYLLIVLPEYQESATQIAREGLSSDRWSFEAAQLFSRLPAFTAETQRWIVSYLTTERPYVSEARSRFKEVGVYQPLVRVLKQQTELLPEVAEVMRAFEEEWTPGLP